MYLQDAKLSSKEIRRLRNAPCDCDKLSEIEATPTDGGLLDADAQVCDFVPGSAHSGEERMVRHRWEKKKSTNHLKKVCV